MPDNRTSITTLRTREHHSTEQSARHLTGRYLDAVRAIGQGGVLASIDPSTSSAPITDAADALRAAPGPGWSGVIELPPGGVEQSETISLEGHGGFVSPGARNGRIQFTEDVVGLELGEQGHTTIRGGLTLEGPGWDVGTQPAIKTTSNGPWHCWDHIETRDWGGQTLLAEAEPQYFWRVGLWRASKHDPARQTSQLPHVWDSVGGKSNSFGGVILSNPEQTPSGTTPGGYLDKGYSSIQTLEVLGDIGSGDAGRPLVNARNRGYLDIDYLNAEPIGVDVPRSNIGVRVASSAVRVGHMTLVDRETWHAMLLNGGANGSSLPSPHLIGSSSTEEMLTVASAPTAPVDYRGEQSTVNDATGSTGWPAGVSCVDGYLSP